ncbi:MAG: DUF484 family protein [Thiomonas sp.]|uniref:DUF484 family protein n=1 Tax=Thiomonas sp. TaxID=2047785 RepID=UPI002A367D92|nr:DUF484 family protein [Thiomonas sp.]MDY0330006.1 DUF484 family protein [Thiomonas sp.]
MELSEHDLATYLAANPEFFERHAELLTMVQLHSPHGNRAVSLQERQMEMLRDKMRTLEHRLAAMMRNAVDNETLAGKLLLWARDCLLAQQGAPAQLPQTLQDTLKAAFDLPMTALKLWPVREEFAALEFATGVSEDARTFAASLSAPFVGPNPGFEAAHWLPDAQMAQSLALIPLQNPHTSLCMGLLVLASPDTQRFTADMGTDFLTLIGQLASAALVSLLAC